MEIRIHSPKPNKKENNGQNGQRKLHLQQTGLQRKLVIVIAKSQRLTRNQTVQIVINKNRQQGIHHLQPQPQHRQSRPNLIVIQVHSFHTAKYPSWLSFQNSLSTFSKKVIYLEKNQELRR